MSSSLRSLTIKTNALKRIVKEKGSYVKEAHHQKERVEKMRAENADEYELRAQEKVLVDCDQMVPETQKRLETAVEDLKQLIASGDPAFEGTAELEAAKAAVADAEKTA
ncbi:tubulin binding cofactor A [Saitoella complicata NRRL Y-17804]|nr:tubulin binding cofactor A [Saitoella complicata NRRL Y-17804]ODQ50153.1 tubulin binding cofactor A [Saitoella complicata NRRL Y-17804]